MALERLFLASMYNIGGWTLVGGFASACVGLTYGVMYSGLFVAAHRADRRFVYACLYCAVVVITTLARPHILACRF